MGLGDRCSRGGDPGWPVGDAGRAVSEGWGAVGDEVAVFDFDVRENVFATDVIDID
jgi:hypothetical protein